MPRSFFVGRIALGNVDVPSTGLTIFQSEEEIRENAGACAYASHAK